MTFVTNITGVPTTGEYGSDGNPLNINNNGGTEITPQNAGNVPSAGTESRISGNNDKILSGSPYNSNSSSTDAQAIGPSRPAKTFYANAQSHSLYKQASISNDKTHWDNYNQDVKNVAERQSYNGYFEIQNQADLEEGQTTTNFTVFDDSGNPSRETSSMTVNLGGQTQTSTTTANSTTYTLNTAPRGCRTPSGLVDNPCEMVNCAAGSMYPLGKKMRLFLSDRTCDGRGGYWMQLTNPIEIKGPNRTVTSSGFDGHEDPIVRDCDFYKHNQRTRKTTHKPQEVTNDCWTEYIQTVGGNPIDKPVYSHLLTYVGTDLATIKDTKWCKYCNQNAPADSSSDNNPSKEPCADVSGWQQMFYEGLSCQKNADGEYERDLETHKGKLYSCCCPNSTIGRCGRNRYGAGNDVQQVLVTLTEVEDTITAGSSEDPCDCLYRHSKGPRFLDEWKGSQGDWAPQYRTDQAVLLSGCNKLAAEDLFAGPANNIYVVASGGATFGGGPTWNSGECAWDTPVKLAERCVKYDSVNGLGYCSSGPLLTMSDRNLFVGVGHINNKSCDTSGCAGVCVTGAVTAKFNIGDQVTLANFQPTTYEFSAGAWYDPEGLNLLASGAQGGIPFQTGCEEEIGMCSWIFVVGGPHTTGFGNWVLDSDDCCDCSIARPSSGLQPDGSFTGTQYDTVSTDCGVGTTGCGIEYCWKVTDRQLGQSAGYDIDCTWGYTVSFTGNDPSVDCPATGTISKYILEPFFTSGDC